MALDLRLAWNMILYKYQVASFPVVFLRKCLMLTWTIYARELSAALLLLFETRWFTHFVRNAQNLYGRFLPDLGISGLTSLMLSSWRGLSGPPDACLAQIWLYRHDDREYVTHTCFRRPSPGHFYAWLKGQGLASREELNRSKTFGLKSANSTVAWLLRPNDEI